VSQVRAIVKLFYDLKIGGVSQLRYLHIDPTWWCNLRCRMCEWDKFVNRQARNNIDLSLFKRIVDEGMEWGLEQVFIGASGEPTLHPQIMEIIQYVLDRCLRTQITTNLNIYEPEIVHMLANLETLSVSIDAAKKQTYERIRVGGNFKLVIHNIEQIVRLNPKVITMCFVIQRDNVDEMIDYVHLAGDLGVKDVSFTMTEYFDEASYDAVALSHVQINELKQNVVEVQRQAAKRGVKVTGLSDVQHLANFPNRNVERFPKRGQSYVGPNVVPCYSTWIGAFINASGLVFLCCQGAMSEKMALGDLKQHSLSEIWQDAFRPHREFLMGKRKPAFCQTCVQELFHRRLHRYIRRIPYLLNSYGL